MKETVEGIIMVISCQKHKNTRLKEFGFPHNEYCNSKWKVFYIIGDLFQDEPYKIEGNIMYVKVEDSYIHLLKKVVLSMKYLYEIFDIKQGIIKTTDDIIVNETKLIEFLETPNKPDFFGESNIHTAVINIGGTEYLFYDKDRFRLCIYDDYMVDYYKTHPDELLDPYNNLMNVCISDYRKRPDTCHVLVKTVYLSNRACDVLIRHMEGIQWNVFAWDEFTQSYPYCLEDRAITFILIFNGIPLTNATKLSAGDINRFNDYITIFTRKYK